MKCPEEVAESILEILRIGLLRARAAGWARDAERCALEADHLHNLPGLLADYTPERLRYYLEAETPAITAHAGFGDEELARHWKILETHLEHQHASR
jgi:hypothetical protein